MATKTDDGWVLISERNPGERLYSNGAGALVADVREAKRFPDERQALLAKARGGPRRNLYTGVAPYAAELERSKSNRPKR